MPINQLKPGSLSTDDTILLHDAPGHQVYWVGAADQEEAAIPCNSWLVVDQDAGFLIEPGGCDHYFSVSEKIDSVFLASSISHLICSHQDPDVCASIPSWIEHNPRLKVVVPHLWHRFLPHYMAQPGEVTPVGDRGALLPMPGGAHLRCIPAPFLHSPGNMVIFDEASGFLFSGDIGASVFDDDAFVLCIDDWQRHCARMLGFHQRYMGSNRAVARFVASVRDLPIRAILPQHGAIFRGDEVGRFLDWLGSIDVGIDALGHVA
ncbi:MAG: MBL fold metallo-hydrolase [Zetaproteobacteria bacterium]|nr:MAG: MBL fold metallo-hydrolase [Zetaproteobacteria bacterium]